MADLNWSDAQWQKVNDCVTEAFAKASVASAFLPLYGPLPGSTETVRNERLMLRPAAPPTLPTVLLDADHAEVNIRLINVTANVELSSEQVAEESLSNAMLAFRRAANYLAQEEDDIVFQGFRRSPVAGISAFVRPNAQPQRGLADFQARSTFAPVTPGGAAAPAGAAATAWIGPALVPAVVAAIGRLEATSNLSPFYCVLSNDLFDHAHDPNPLSLVLPADRIAPFLTGGSLLRSGMMPTGTGVVVSLSAGAVDIVVGTPPTVQFLQRTTEGRFLFRVYERFALRIRDVGVGVPVAGFVV